MYGIVRALPDSGSHVVGDAWACVGGASPGTAAPGDSIVVQASLASSESPNADPPITMRERTGLFRIELDLVVGDSETSPRVPVEQRRSNAFQIYPPD